MNKLTGFKKTLQRARAAKLTERFTLTQLALLLELNEGPCSVKHLKDELDVSSPSISVTVDMLAENGRRGVKGLGLVRRTKNIEDARVCVVELTGKGQRLMEVLSNA